MFFLRFGLVFSLCAAAGNVFAMGNLETNVYNSALIGKAAPNLTLPKTDGTSGNIVSSDHTKKVLVFWATWCPHCREELEHINGQLAMIEAKGIKIVLVDIGETVDEVKAYLTQHKINMPSFIDEENALQEPYDLVGVPYVVFVDENGIVRYDTHGFPSNYEDHFK